MSDKTSPEYKIAAAAAVSVCFVVGIIVDKFL